MMIKIKRLFYEMRLSFDREQGMKYMEWHPRKWWEFATSFATVLAIFAFALIALMVLA